MNKSNSMEANQALEIRKVAIAKKYTKSIAITIICFSVLSFAFTAGYMGTFLLFK
ncbi:MAG: hypothetical protein IJ217_00905 [Clostridia bacterium]|nr:hypothetical protein [Clostridia bacterium]